MKKKLRVAFALSLVITASLIYAYIQTSAKSEIIPDEAITADEQNQRSIEQETTHGYDEPSAINESEWKQEDVLPEENISEQRIETNISNETVHGYYEPSSTDPAMGTD